MAISTPASTKSILVGTGQVANLPAPPPSTIFSFIAFNI